MTALELQSAPLTNEQWEKVRALATSLDSKQLIWVSGFMAGVEEAASRALPTPKATDATTPSSAQSRTLSILHGSETGNSTALAKALAQRATEQGLTVAVHDMRSYKTRQLKDEQDVLVVVSTYGDGDPPDPGIGFFEFIEGRKAPEIPAVRFSVLALGDTTYQQFCEAGKRLDRRFEALGAKRLLPRIDCDVDYDEPADKWMTDVLATLVPTTEPGIELSSAVTTSPVVPATGKDLVYSRRNPFSATVLENLPLTGRGSSKQTRHIELSVEGSCFAFEPGDALGFIPENDSAVVESLINAIGANPSDKVDVKGELLPLNEALTSYFEVTTLTPRFLEYWANVSESEYLKRLASDDHAAERLEFSNGHHVIDLVRQFRVSGIDVASLVTNLRPLQPRLYSIASSLSIAPEEVHLTVSTVRYDLHGERRQGVSSGHIADRATQDSVLSTYIHSNPKFRLPGDDVPIIMIGAGTGVAPYRAFMQEREARGAQGRSWLFFGERNFRTDFLYQTEWQTYLRDGVMTRMDVAFSRDQQSDDRARVYVQTRILERSRDVFSWLQDGACIYVCGDASRLAPDVHQALATVVSSEGGMDIESAYEYLRHLQQDRRYQRDVY